MTVFIIEGQRAVTGQVLVSDARAPARTELVREEDDRLELAVREHARLVYRVAYSVLRDHHDAEDATQETFLRVLRYRRKAGGVRRPERGWRGLRGGWRLSGERKAAEVSLDDDGSGVSADSFVGGRRRGDFIERRDERISGNTDRLRCRRSCAIR